MPPESSTPPRRQSPEEVLQASPPEQRRTEHTSPIVSPAFWTFSGSGLPVSSLGQRHDNRAAIQNRNWQQVEEADPDGQKRRQMKIHPEQLGDTSGAKVDTFLVHGHFGDAPRQMKDADRTRQLVDAFLACDKAAQDIEGLTDGLSRSLEPIAPRPRPD